MHRFDAFDLQARGHPSVRCVSSMNVVGQRYTFGQPIGVELYEHQFQDEPELIEHLGNRLDKRLPLVSLVVRSIPVIVSMHDIDGARHPCR